MQPNYSNARTGIELARAGRRWEALAYLRQAVQNEPPHPEVWLWLAHVSNDLNEYRNCVYQALQLDAYHMVARQMQEALGLMARDSAYQQAYPAVAPAGTSPYGQPYAAYATPVSADTPPTIRKGRKRRRFLLRVIIALAGLAIGIGLAMILGLTAV